MKLINIKISGFNSFKNEQFIDFVALAQNRLFCISGDTGSGKTTILDAIVFALYGDLDRAKQSEELINSDCDRATIEFCVELDGERYTILRELKRGKGASVCKVKQNQKVIIDKTTELKKFVAEKVGLTKEEFVSVVVLQQGKFGKFLTAERSERAKIVESLFKLHKYEHARASIDIQRKLTEADVQNIDKQLEKYEQVSKELLEELTEKCKNIVAQIQSAQEISDTKNKAYNDLVKFKEKYDNLVKCKQQIEQTEQLIAREKQTLENLEKDKQALIKDGEQFVLFCEQIERLDKQAQEYFELKSRADVLQNNTQKVESLRKDYQAEIESIRKSEQTLEQTLADINSLCNGEIDQNGLPVALKNGQSEEEILAFKQTVDDIEKQKNAHYLTVYRAYTIQCEKEKELEKKKADLEKKKAELEVKKTISLTLLKEKNALEGELEQANEKLKKAELDHEIQTRERLAHTIRLSLKKGDVCPVCKNVIKDLAEHGEGEVDTKSILDQAKKQKENIESLLKAKEMAVIGAQREYANCQKNVSDDQKEIEDLQSQLKEKITKQIVDELSNTVSCLRKASAKVGEYVGAIKRIEDATKNAEKIRLDGIRLKEECEKEKELLVSKCGKFVSSEIEQMRQSVLKNRQQLQESKNDFDKKLASVETAIIKSQTTVEQSVILVNTLKESIKMDDTLGLKVDQNQIDKAKEEFDYAEKEKQSLVEERFKMEAEKTVKEKEWQEKLGLEKEKKELARKYAVYNEIISVCRGRAFTEFVAEMYVEEFTLDASERMEALTGGRYVLVYENGAFAVIDNFANKAKRNVSTLSGGEKFIASLSLAIAISKYIAQNNDFGFFFIDEGFGSLDQKTLDDVCGALETLSRDTVVGVISHVKGLIERMPTVLQVKKADGENGSIVTMH